MCLPPRRGRPARGAWGHACAGAFCACLWRGAGGGALYNAWRGALRAAPPFPADTAWTAPGPLRYRYFSFVTLATLGYGDVTPVTALAGTLAALDAVSGQLYIAITVARLVALSMGEHVGPGGGPKSGG